MMKRILLLFVLIFSFFLTTCSQVLANAVWDNPKTIRTYIQPHSKSALMKQAFSAWTTATKGKIAFKYVQDPEKAQIKVKFVRDIYDVTGNKTTIGQTYHRSMGGHMIFAEITISERSPNGALFRKDAVYRVMVHEIGHALGIFDHSPNKSSIMYYAKASRNQAITKYDVDFISKLYGWD
ncbi:matrixin family metalloprotease [bacterium]|nr:matrixin family metalloprotease [bacterium]